MTVTDESGMNAPDRDLNRLFALEPLGDSRFSASGHDANLNGRVFGGQLLAQTLLAAQHVCPGVAATLHVLFLRGALPDEPLRYEVQVLQSGRRFSSCRVRGSQRGRAVVEAQVTLQQLIEGYRHAAPAPEVANPEQLPALSQMRDATGASLDYMCKPGIELRLIATRESMSRPTTEARLCYWAKLQKPLGGDLARQQAALAYLSDYWINGAAIGHHVPLVGARDSLYVASLNHSLWFHAASCADDWLLFVCESPVMQRGRGLTWVRIYDRDRQLVASASQESVIGLRQNEE